MISNNTGEGSSQGSAGMQAIAVPNSFTIENFNPEVTTWRRWLQGYKDYLRFFGSQVTLEYLTYYITGTERI